MRAMILALTLLLPGSAMAHVGHIAEVAGHSHWIAGATIGLAVLVGLWGKRKDRTEPEQDPEESDAEPEESPA